MHGHLAGARVAGGSTQESGPVATLDRSGWHSPLVSVIITHHNYSDHVDGALLSLLDQSHANWECIVVDDASAPEHREKLLRTIARLDCAKVRIILNPENMGQINSFYAGVDNSSGDFLALLDPDDRYAPTFLAEAVAAHLDDTFFCPLVCTDQFILTRNGVTTGTIARHRRSRLKVNEPHRLARDAAPPEPERIYFVPYATGWLWTSVSAMVFRRAVLKYLRPHRPLPYKGEADAYLAAGAHILGGTLFVTKSLVYRGVHDANTWLTEDLFSMDQSYERLGATDRGPLCRRDVVEAMLHNGVQALFRPEYLAGVIRTHFSDGELRLLHAASPEAARLVPKQKPKRRPLASRLMRSVRKRLGGS